MTGFTAIPATDTDWPEQELSPYADWWRRKDKYGGQREAGSYHDLVLSLVDLEERGADDRQVQAFTALSVERSVPRTTLPLWSQAWPSGAQGEGLDEKPATAQFGDRLKPANPKPKAIAVIIDMATNPLHERFRDGPDKTRILAHWQMDGTYLAGSKRVPFGREIRADDISAQLTGPEDAALQTLGLVTMSHPFGPRGPIHRDAHGTHVLDLFVGTEPRDDGQTAKAIRQVPILSVALPTDRIMSAQGVFLEAFVDLALSWVLRRLKELFPGGDWPQVILNLSYGLAAGPKDGTGQLPNRISDFAAGRAVKVFLPAGNDGKAIDQAHDFGKSLGRAVLRGKAGENAISWKVMAADPYSAYAELWLTGDGTGAQVCLTDPMGTQLTVAAAAAKGEAEELAWDLVPAAGGPAVARIFRLGPVGKNGRRGFVLCIAPTHNPDLSRPRAEAGYWTISILNANGDLRGDLHLQSERPLEPRYRLGHPSRLVPIGAGPGPQRGGTLNAVSHGADATVVTTTRLDRKGAPVNYSSADDPSAPFSGVTVTEQAAELSSARQYVRAAGHLSGSQAVVRGTSFACALASHAALCTTLGVAPIRP